MTGPAGAGILVHPHPVLRSPAAPARDAGETGRLVRTLWRVCRRHGAAGLAAPQIGVSLRVAVVDGRAVGAPVERIVLIDPELLETAGSVRREEGCLSFPGLYATVRRPRRIAVRTTTPSGNTEILALEGLAARAVCHETDHLDGVLLPDRLGPIGRRLFLLRHWIRNRRRQSPLGSPARGSSV